LKGVSQGQDCEEARFNDAARLHRADGPDGYAGTDRQVLLRQATLVARLAQGVAK
jgi:hypothetical protein